LKRKALRWTLDPSIAVLRKSVTLAPAAQCHEYVNDNQIAELRTLSDVMTKKKPISSLDWSNILQILGYTPGSKYGFLRLRASVSYPIGIRLNIIQHPQGRKKEVVVQQNELKDVHTNVIHYYSDTDYGSSGSPVFDNKWDLMALHHARDSAESANEGIRIDKIVADLKNEFQNSNPGILTELGI
jgi:V8-like Glu-specific endopeptidase